MTLTYSGQIGGPFGWGVCNLNMTRELGKLIDLQLVNNADRQNKHIDADMLMQPCGPQLSMPVGGGKFNIGYAFFEEPLQPEAVNNAKQWDVLFVGSSWCVEECAKLGISATLLLQGIDRSIFRPMGLVRKNVVFSGGKLEPRKGQDIVLASVRGNMLVTAWHNPWPQNRASMLHAPLVKSGKIIFWPSMSDESFCRLNHTSSVNLPAISQQEMALVMNQCGCGVFPNRVEGGTNLVLMEALACGLPCFASDCTGHKDLAGAYIPIGKLTEQILELFSKHGRIKVPNPEPILSRFTWDNAARIVVEAIKQTQVAGL